MAMSLFWPISERFYRWRIAVFHKSNRAIKEVCSPAIIAPRLSVVVKSPRFHSKYPASVLDHTKSAED